MMKTIQMKRAYDPVGPHDGLRILVDRLWPRGVTKEAAHIDLWLKDVAPSTALRKWFGHDPLKWAEFQQRYLIELQGNAEAVAQLVGLTQQGKVTLIYAAKDGAHNHALALKEYLERMERHA